MHVPLLDGLQEEVEIGVAVAVEDLKPQARHVQVGELVSVLVKHDKHVP